MRSSEGCVLMVRKIVFNKLNEPESECKLHPIEDTIGMVTCGFKNQSALLVAHAKELAKNYRLDFHKRIPLKKLSDDLSSFINRRTFMSFTSPFCVYVILCSWSESNGAELFCVNLSAESYGVFGCAVGKWKQQAEDEISKCNFASFPIEKLIQETLKVIVKLNRWDLEENKNVESSLSVFWIGKNTGGKIQHFSMDEKVLKELLNQIQV